MNAAIARPITGLLVGLTLSTAVLAESASAVTPPAPAKATSTLTAQTSISINAQQGTISRGKTTAYSTALNAQGKMASSPITGDLSSAKAETYECLTNRIAPNLRTFKPTYISVDNLSRFMQYAYHLNTVDNARIDGKQGYQYQMELCVTGGAKTQLFIRPMNRTVASMSARDSQTVLIGKSWGTKNRDGSVGAKLGFSLGGNVSPISVSGEIPLSGGGVWGGDIGPDLGTGRLNNPQNQVNSYWETGTFGLPTQKFKGNVGHGLWEWNQTDTRTHTIDLRATAGF